MFYQTFAINQNLYSPCLLLRENDAKLAMPAVDGSHLGCRFFYFRTKLITVSSEIFAGILFSRISLKVIFATLKNRD